ncbi:MAG: glycoside hydrolase N-terminal domain-containing protein [Bacteroidales bacterium]|nr:glycoside hydrolase N-terminal domain-containing protein [Bacteroidales bacterium]
MKTSLFHRAASAATLLLMAFYGASANAEIIPRSATSELTLWSTRPFTPADDVVPLGNGRIQVLANGAISQDTLHVLFNSLAASDLLLAVDGHSDVIGYRNWFDLTSATSGLCYRIGDVDYRREMFCSQVDSVVLLRLETSKKGKLSLRVTSAVKEVEASAAGDKRTLAIHGTSAETLIRVVETDGKASTGKRDVEVKGATQATVAISVAPSAERAMQLLNDYEARQKSYDLARLDHQKHYRKTFDRVHVSLGFNETQAKKSTPARVSEFTSADDPSLAALYFQLGRYLLFMGAPDFSRNDPSLAVCYWPAEVCNLSECHEPFLSRVKTLADAASSPAVKADLLAHVREHYLYTGSKKFLAADDANLRASVPACGALANETLAPLWSLYPAGQVSPYIDSTLFAATRQLLIGQETPAEPTRAAWFACLWARLLDGNRALDLLRGKLFAHVEANAAYTAAMAEMLLQSHAGCVHLLPSLPDEWKTEGNVRGLCARGGFEIVDMTWKFGRIERVVIRSRLGGNLRLRSATPLKLDGALGLKFATDANPNPLTPLSASPKPAIEPLANAPAIELKHTFVYDLDTQAGKTYTFVPN